MYWQQVFIKGILGLKVTESEDSDLFSIPWSAYSEEPGKTFMLYKFFKHL